MSFITFAFFVFFFYFCASSTNEQEEFILPQSEYPGDDTPSGNFTLQFGEHQGKCPKLPNANTTRPNPEMIEGRWYMVQTGILPSKAQTITCTVWNFFMDEQKILHKFMSLLENGQLKTSHSKLTPINRLGNVFMSESGPESELDSNYKITFYFVDPEFFISIIVGCKVNGNHYRDIAVGVRDLLTTSTRSSDINSIIQAIEDDTGFTTDKTELSHAGCSYPSLSKIRHIK